MKHCLDVLTKKEAFLASGLMSGTSMDGVDAALVRLPASAEERWFDLVGFTTTPYPKALADALRSLAFGDPCTASEIATLHTSVAIAFANAFHTVCREHRNAPEDVDFIGSHGQTVAHVPPGAGGDIAGTLQLGPPGMIAALTGVTTVGDFRVTDMALGGQGAPLAPYIDYLLRRSGERSRVILNIGGIANVTYLPKNGGADEVVAFDTGPGNMVLDELYRVLYPSESGYDRMVTLIQEGAPSPSIVETFMGIPFFKQKPPKSAGHREFGGEFAWEFLARAEAAGLKKPDVLASALSLTTQSIATAIAEFITPEGGIDEVLVTGGGSHNPVMMAELTRSLVPAEVGPIDKLGLSADAKEAVDFAVLAREAILGRLNVLKRVTGASQAAVLGTIAPGLGGVA